MRKIWAICRKELISYFSSPVAYIVSTVFLLISGYFFTVVIAYTKEASMRYLFHNMSIILLLVAPMLTMRMFAEERKLGTFEMLMTAPLRIWELVAGKFLGVAIMFLIIMAVSLEFPLFLLVFGNPDFGPLLTGYLGFILMGFSFLAVGMFASSLTDNQIVATVISFGILLLLWIIGWAGDLAGGLIGRFIQSLSVFDRFDSFTKGLLDTGDAFFYLSVIGIFVFLTARSLDWKRW